MSWWPLKKFSVPWQRPSKAAKTREPPRTMAMGTKVQIIFCPMRSFIVVIRCRPSQTLIRVSSYSDFT